MGSPKEIVEFGDFQTPIQLAQEVIAVVDPKDDFDLITEPTCGLGTFLRACLEYGVEPSKLEGWEINPDYVDLANESLQSISGKSRQFVAEQDFFQIDWAKLKGKQGKSILFIGNPPWVTNSELGRLLSTNLPEKSNFQDLTGLEAMTGKSNFDISEWMLMQLLEFISGTSSSIAFLIKTSVARKLFQYAANTELLVSEISIREIDAKKHFDVSVDACLFCASGTALSPDVYQCAVYTQLSSPDPYKKMGLSGNKLVSDIETYKTLSYIDQGSELKWRSGVKHDASKIMEFVIQGDTLINGQSEVVDLPFDYLYPMYKSSHISKTIIKPPAKYMLVTQQKIGDETFQIKETSSATWKYLTDHAEILDDRKSSIYKSSPRFSVFGVGEYSFAPWKVVISGLYKNLIFSKIGSYNGKPIVVDDTCYMLGFEKEEQADFVLAMLTSDICQHFIEAIVFRDNKRPITVALLNRISIQAIAIELGLETRFQKLFESENSQLALL